MRFCVTVTYFFTEPWFPYLHNKLVISTSDLLWGLNQTTPRECSPVRVMWGTHDPVGTGTPSPSLRFSFSCSFVHSFTLSFMDKGWRTCNVPVTVLGAGETTWKDSPYPQRVYSQVKRQASNGVPDLIPIRGGGASTSPSNPPTPAGQPEFSSILTLSTWS